LWHKSGSVLKNGVIAAYATITPYWAVNIQNTGLQQMEEKALGLWKFCLMSPSSPNVRFIQNGQKRVTSKYPFRISLAHKKKVVGRKK